MNVGFIVVMGGLVVAGLASLVGVWIERDAKKPLRWSITLSIVIFLAILVSIFQSCSGARAQAQLEEDMARMLENLDQISSESSEEDPTLHNFISKELKTQTRANLAIIERVIERVKAEGGSPFMFLGKYLPASELKWLEKLGKIEKGEGDEISAQSSSTRLQQKLKDVERNLAEAEKKISELSQENAALRSKLETSRDSLEKANADVAAAEARLEELKKQAAELEESLKSKKPRGSSSSSGQTPIWQKG